MANVKFYAGTRKQYDSLVSRNPLALYFCDDTGELFKGDVCLSDGIMSFQHVQTCRLLIVLQTVSYTL